MNKLNKHDKRNARYTQYLEKLKKISNNYLGFHTSQLTELYYHNTSNNLFLSHGKSEEYNLKLVETTSLGIKANSFADIHLNNAGSPYTKSSVWSLETKEFEVEVLEMWARFLGAQPHTVTGYVTSGSTEGNMASMSWHMKYFENSLFNLKKSKLELLNEKVKIQSNLGICKQNSCYKKYYFLDKEIQSLKKDIEHISSPVLYATEQPHSHYSIAKIASLYKLKVEWITYNADGSMDLSDFQCKIQSHSKFIKKSPAIININIGTTITGAIDDAPKILKILKKYQINYTIHLDAAMLGAVLKFIKPYPNVVNYFKDLEVKTIAISGHKFLGTNQITGVVCADEKFLSKAFSKIESNIIKYTGNLHDITVSGSRSGLNIILLHNIMSYLDMDDNYSKLKILVQSCFSNLDYLYHSLVKVIGTKNVICLPKQFNILFVRPSQKLQKKYGLMPVLNNYSSIIVTAKATKEKIKNFLEEYRKDDDIISKFSSIG